MAPEVYSGKYGLSCDIYSLGVVFYEIFERKPLTEVWDKTRQTLVLPKKFMSSPIVVPMTALDPGSRPDCIQVCFLFYFELIGKL